MPYVEGFTVHDADTHIMELPDCLDAYVEPAYRDELQAAMRAARASKFVETGWADVVKTQHADPEFRATAPENIMLRKQHEAMGAFENADRPAAIDLLGFASQLVFPTLCLGNFGLDHSDRLDLAYAAALAHNRMMLDFCSVDRRLLATAYVPIADMERAPGFAREAIAMGAKAIMIPSRCPKGHSPSHVGLDPLWAIVEEAGLPIIFHVGGQERVNTDYCQNGGPVQLDWLGGAENFTSITFMSVPTSVMQTMATLIFDGVLDRFPRLKFGAIELGASWVPSWMQFIDSAFDAFGKEERLKRLSAKPSEIIKRQFRATPYCHENVGWIIQNGGEDVALFSSDYPHREGGRNPINRFEASMAAAGCSDVQRRKFYRDNFIDLMGRGLDPALHDAPQRIAA